MLQASKPAQRFSACLPSFRNGRKTSPRDCSGVISGRTRPHPGQVPARQEGLMELGGWEENEPAAGVWMLTGRGGAGVWESVAGGAPSPTSPTAHS